MEFSFGWFAFFAGLTWVGWFVYVLATEGTSGISKRWRWKMPAEKPKVDEVAAAAAEMVGEQPPAPSAKKIEPKPGFRDMRWGDPPRPTMSVLQTEGETELYMRATDKMRHGRAELLRINYQFWRHKFAGVVLQVAPGSLEPVIDELVAEFGRFSQPKENKSRYLWLWVGAGATAVQVVLDADLEKQSATVMILSKSLSEERKASSASLVAAGGGGGGAPGTGGTEPAS